MWLLPMSQTGVGGLTTVIIFGSKLIFLSPALNSIVIVSLREFRPEAVHSNLPLQIDYWIVALLFS